MRRFCRQTTIRICRRPMCCVGSFFSLPIHHRIAGIRIFLSRTVLRCGFSADRLLVFVYGLVYFNRRKTFMTGICPDYRPINAPIRRNQPLAIACLTVSSKSRSRTPVSSNRCSLFLENVKASHTGDLIFSPKNQRNAMLHYNSIINFRSEQTPRRYPPTSARNNCSRGINGRPLFSQ